MDKFIMFAGRQIPIAIPYPVFSYVNNTGPSFYKPDATLTEDRLIQMSLLRPDRRNYSWRARLTRTPEQLFNVPQDEVEMLGQLVHQIALHHDVTTDAPTTFNVLCTRGLSTHFVVNYDGALYQFMDCYHVAWATGDNNAHSIAIDMNNPVYPEMRDSDPAAGMREIYQGKVNGSVKTMLGYTEAQYDTIIALIKALTSPVRTGTDPDWVPLPKVAANCFPPISESGEVINGLLRDSVGFHGFLGHFHCSANKWDPGPAFDWLRVLSGIKGEQNSLPMLLGEKDERRNLDQAGGAVLEELLMRYYKNAENAPGGWYPMGANQSWHSGIHLTAPEGTPVLAMMSGTIVAVRNVKTVDLGDPSFVLIRHEREEDLDGEKTKVFWYSLYMHLEPMLTEEQFDITWVSDLLGANLQVPDEVKYRFENLNVEYEKGIPQVVDGTVVSKNYDEILKAFFKGDIILTNIDCKAGTPIGTIGRFGTAPDRLSRQLHVEVFSKENIFQRGNAQGEAWSVIEGDISDYSLVRVKKILKPIIERVEERTQRTPVLLKTAEIQDFYVMGDSEPLASRRDAFRKMICYHRSEWSPLMNWTKTALQSVGWQWESENQFGAWLLKWLPFQWLTPELTPALKLPKDHFFYTYHPIYLLEQLNMTYSGDITHNAEEAGADEMEMSNEEAAKRLKRLTELNQKAQEQDLTAEEKQEREELYQLMDDHMGDARGDISTETRYDYFYDEQFDHWEPGEWNPPGRNSMKNLK